MGEKIVEYAGFWRRFAAFLIDGIILGIISAILIFIFDQNLTTLAGVIIGWLYYALQESSERQATLGKTVLGIYVTDTEGRRISFLRATGRHFAKILSGLILLIGYIMAAFTARKQALHDMIASTLVLHRA